MDASRTRTAAGSHAATCRPVRSYKLLIVVALVGRHDAFFRITGGRRDNSQGDHTRIAGADSDRYSVAIATVFDQGPWVDMCQYLGLPAVPGTLYGV